MSKEAVAEDHYTFLSPREFKILLVLALVHFTNIVDFMVIMPLGPDFMRVFTLNPQQFAWIVSSYMFSSGVFCFLFALMADRFDRKRLLFINYLGLLIGTLATAAATDYIHLLLARLISGCFGGILVGVVFAIAGDVVPFKRRGRALSIISAAFSLATILGLPIGLSLASAFGWQAPFVGFGIFGSGVAILVLLVVPAQKVRKQKRFQLQDSLDLLRDLVTIPTQRNVQMINVLLMFSQFSIVPFISPFFTKNLNFNHNDLSLLYILGGIATIVFAPFIGRATDRFGAKRVFSTALLVSIPVIIALTHLDNVGKITALFVTTCFMVVGTGRMISLMTMLTSAVPHERRGSFLNISTALGEGIAGIAAAVAGFFVSESIQGKLLGYEYVGFISVGVTILVLFLLPKITILSEKGS